MGQLGGAHYSVHLVFQEGIFGWWTQTVALRASHKALQTLWVFLLPLTLRSHAATATGPSTSSRYTERHHAGTSEDQGGGSTLRVADVLEVDLIIFFIFKPVSGIFLY